MNDSMVDRYRRWFEYEKDSHARTLDSLNAVPEKLHAAEAFRKAIYLLGHIIAARRMWLFRFGVAKENAELFPRDVELADLRAQIAETEALWSEYLSQLNDTDLARVSSIKATKVRAFAIRLKRFSRSCLATPGITADRLHSLCGR